jgi:hypothetical protein
MSRSPIDGPWFCGYDVRIDNAHRRGEVYMGKHIILGVHITNRLKDAMEIQRLFTEYGCNIKTRLGLHEVGKDECSPSGVVLLEMWGEEEQCLSLGDKLKKIDGVEVQRMIFEHPAAKK